jgi:hypothetical protein
LPRMIKAPDTIAKNARIVWRDAIGMFITTDRPVTTSQIPNNRNPRFFVIFIFLLFSSI